MPRALFSSYVLSGLLERGICADLGVGHARIVRFQDAAVGGVLHAKKSVDRGTMTVVCATDFSQNSAEAEAAAALVAKRLGTAFELVHVTQSGASGTARLVEGPEKLLSERAQKIGQLHHIAAKGTLLEGAPERRLPEFAVEAQAQLIVVAALGAGAQRGFLVGSVAERIVQNSSVPVLVVREASGIRAWLQGERRLRVMLGVDMGESSRAALRWVEQLRKIAACDLQIVQVVWPVLEHSRFGVSGPIALEGMKPELQELLERDLKAWAGTVEGEGSVSFVVSPGWGRCDSHLTLLASSAQVDLLVVGTHQRFWAARAWQGSVSRGVLHGAATNVACVPRGAADERSKSVARFKRVLIPTDFSETANCAIASGYGILQPGGEAHLVHVRLPEDEEVPVSELEARLRGLIPIGAAALHVATEVHVISDHEAYAGIVRLAGRLAVDAICMATHGRTGISELVLGSQAREVLRLASQAVLLVKAPRE